VLQAGDIVDGKYRIVRPIGEGGMGAVFEAEHEAIRRRVALKVLFREHALDPEMVVRFHREAQAAGRIGHENICEVTDVGRLPGGEPFLVMPLLKGEPLSGVLHREAPLAVDRAAELTCQILEALAAAHGAGIVHRDLKPDNVFVTRLGERGFEFVKVLDFGISKVLGTASVDGDRQITRTGSVLGTPCYMAPEQARGEKDLDQRVDIFAAGAILYEMVVGRRALDAENINLMLIRAACESPDPPRKVRPELPEAVEAVILRAMERDRTRRFQSADDFRHALRRAAETVRRSAPGAAPLVAEAPTLASTAGPPPAASPATRTPGPFPADATTARPPAARSRTIVRAVAVLVPVAVVGVWLAWSRLAAHDSAAPAAAGSSPDAASAPDAVDSAPLRVEPAEAGASEVVEAAPAPDAAEPGTAPADAVETVVITFANVPPGATIRLGDATVEGTSAVRLRSPEPLAVVVTLRGYETFRTTVVPSDDRTVDVRMTRRTAGNLPRTDAGAPVRDAGAADARRVEGRLGTSVVDDLDADPL
jgi:tRNA A-37 threonylcarbamoyl transferase component Bud32